MGTIALQLKTEVKEHVLKDYILTYWSESSQCIVTMCRYTSPARDASASHPNSGHKYL